MKIKMSAQQRRERRVRKSLKSSGRIRLSVFRSIGQIYVQVIDDRKGETLASASSLDESIRELKVDGGKVSRSFKVGELVAKRALAAGVKEVVFDRGRFLYHGRIKALADGARNGGLVF